MATKNELLVQADIRRTVRLEKTRNSLARRVKNNLNKNGFTDIKKMSKNIDKLTSKLEETIQPAAKRRIKAQLKAAKTKIKVESRKRATVALNDATKELNKDLKAFAKSELDKQVNGLERVLGKKINRPNNSSVKAISDIDFVLPGGFDAKSEMNKIKASTRKNITKSVNTGSLLTKGRDAKDLIDGSINRSIAQVQTIAKTNMKAIESEIKLQIMKDNPDLIDRYLWESVIDSHTTDICRSLNGNTYDVGAGPLPPAMYNCRSSIVPLAKSDRTNPEPDMMVSEALKDESIDSLKATLTDAQFKRIQKLL